MDRQIYIHYTRGLFQALLGLAVCIYQAGSASQMLQHMINLFTR